MTTTPATGQLPPPPPGVPPLPPAPPAEPRVARSTWRAILLAAAIALAFADASIVVLGLPAIYGELQTTVVQASWVITIYALVVAVGGLLAGPLCRRVRPASVVLCGLLLFAAGSMAAGLAGSIGWLFAGRVVQGIGAALALVGSLALLGPLTGSTTRGKVWWSSAAAIGAAIGPALGGVLTEVFDWRAIFFVQVPVALLALTAVTSPLVRGRDLDTEAIAPPVDEPADAVARSTRRALVANAGEVLTFGALVGALFLGVLLLVVVWGYDPIVGAAVVSALPVGSLAVRPLGRRISPAVGGAIGALTLAAGLAGLAFLPRVSGWLAAAAFGLCGAGMGLILGVLGPASLPRAVNPLRGASRSVAARHAGLVLGLILIAPVLAGNLEAKADQSALAGTAKMLEAEVPLRQKIPTAWAIRNELEQTPEGEVPDVDAVFRAQGADENEALARARDDLTGAIQSILTRAFRSSFLIAALLALLAAVPLLVVAGRRPAQIRAGALPVVAACLVGGVAIGFVLAEWNNGAREFGRYEAADPCTASPDAYTGGGIDGAVQRIALGALNGAACELGASREELVLSLDPDSGIGDVDWDSDTAAAAIQSGTVRAIDDAVDRGTLPGWAAAALRWLAERAPFDWFLERLPFGLDD